MGEKSLRTGALPYSVASIPWNMKRSQPSAVAATNRMLREMNKPECGAAEYETLSASDAWRAARHEMAGAELVDGIDCRARAERGFYNGQ